MALSISRKLWRRGRPSFCGVGKSPSMHSHSASERSVGYGLLMHARVAASTPDYPFSDSFEAEYSETAQFYSPRPNRPGVEPASLTPRWAWATGSRNGFAGPLGQFQ